jgi:uncharacterized membrane protein YeaQ/YmgE (transglycosylase-associated protein family)
LGILVWVAIGMGIGLLARVLFQGRDSMHPLEHGAIGATGAVSAGIATSQVAGLGSFAFLPLGIPLALFGAVVFLLASWGLDGAVR